MSSKGGKLLLDWKTTFSVVIRAFQPFLLEFLAPLGSTVCGGISLFFSWFSRTLDLHLGQYSASTKNGKARERSEDNIVLLGRNNVARE